MNISLLSLLFIVFLVLKLTGYIAWSWWLVTAPLWIGFVIWVVIVILVAIYAAIQAEKTMTPMQRLREQARRGRK